MTSGQPSTSFLCQKDIGKSDELSVDFWMSTPIKSGRRLNFGCTIVVLACSDATILVAKAVESASLGTTYCGRFIYCRVKWLICSSMDTLAI